MTVAIQNAHLISGTGEAIERGEVVISGDRIVSAGRLSLAAQRADSIIDLGGRALIPGMIDAHVHMIGGNKAKSLGNESVCFKMYDPPAKALLEGVAAAQIALRAGFTTVREVGGRDYLDVALRDAQRAGLVEAPRILAAGPGVFVTGGPGEYLEPAAAVSGPASATQRVRGLAARGVDVIKLVTADGPDRLGPHWTVLPTAEEIGATFAEATRLGKLKAAHAMGHQGIETVVRAGVDTVEHGWYLSEENCATMRAADAHLIPTISNIGSITSRGPGLEMVWAQMVVEDAPAILDRLRMAIALGVRIAVGTDTGGNESHPHLGENAREVEVYVACGMSPLAAIAAATYEAARAIDHDGVVGSLAPGKLADMVVIDGDPLSDISLLRTGVVAVVQGGSVKRDDIGLFDDLRSQRQAPPVRRRVGAQSV